VARHCLGHRPQAGDRVLDKAHIGRFGGVAGKRQPLLDGSREIGDLAETGGARAAREGVRGAHERLRRVRARRCAPLAKSGL
jgi:hypothetical protein